MSPQKAAQLLARIPEVSAIYRRNMDRQGSRNERDLSNVKNDLPAAINPADRLYQQVENLFTDFFGV